MFGLSGFSWARCGVTICPALLKSLSDGALLAWIAKYLRANWLRRGKSLTWILHHSSGSSSPSMMGNCKYLFISFFNWSRGDCAGEAGWICDNFRMLVREPSVFFTFNGGGWHDLSSDSSSITNVTASLRRASLTVSQYTAHSIQKNSWEDILCLAICRSLMDRDLTCFWKLPQNESSFWIAFVYIKLCYRVPLVLHQHVEKIESW